MRQAILGVSARALLLLSAGLALIFCGFVVVPSQVRAENSQYFAQTGKTVSGKFLDYWQNNGGLATFGYPITDAQNEVDPETGKTFLTQWFERNRFELHPENAGTKYEVLLGLLGKDLRRPALEHDASFAPAQPLAGATFFQETAHNLTGGFLQYWQQNGGLERFGFPISELHQDIDPETGKVFQVQWFERARFEYHPENQPPYNILLGLLGNELKKESNFPARSTETLWKLQANQSLIWEPVRAAADSKGNVYVINQFVDTKSTAIYAIQKYSPDGKLLLRWGTRGSGPGQFIGLIDLAVDAKDNVYVVDSSNHNIQKFDSQGNFLSSWGNSDQMPYPTAIALDSQGNIYIAELGDSHRIQKFNSQGQFLQEWGSFGSGPGQFNTPLGLAFDAKDNLYVADSNNHRIQKFDKQGNFLLQWGGYGTKTGQFQSPQDVKISPAGYAYVADSFNQRVQKFTLDGKYKSKWGKSGTDNGEFLHIRALAIDPQSNVFAVDDAQPDLQKFDQNGKFLSRFATAPDDQFLINEHIGLDGHNNLLVGDWKLSRTQRFDSNGHFAGIEQPFNARAITHDSQGNLYLMTDRALNKYDASGRLVTTYKLAEGAQLVAVDMEGAIYFLSVFTSSKTPVSNMLVFKYTANGDPDKTWADKGKLDLKIGRAYALAVDAQGNLFVGGVNEVRKFDRSGKPALQWGTYGSHDGGFKIINGLDLDGQGNVLVADSENQRIQKFDSQGRLLAKWSIPEGILPQPDAFKVDSNGDVYLSYYLSVFKLRLS
ncbi:MAG TPA: 6-bladed beta-propeller [Chloroflexia bacterium]|nr:6-bladed beta-propeller [Chloroflexia bacterium]